VKMFKAADEAADRRLQKPGSVLSKSRSWRVMAAAAYTVFLFGVGWVMMRVLGGSRTAWLVALSAVACYLWGVALWPKGTVRVAVRAFLILRPDTVTP